MIEIWKDVVDYSGRYKVSSFGRVLSMNYSKTGKSKILKQSFLGDYLVVGLMNDEGLRKTQQVARLVANAFICKKNKYFSIRYKDGDKLNSNLNNLEWDLNKKCCRIRQYNEKGETIKIWPTKTSLFKAKIFNPDVLKYIIENNVKCKDGFKWEYIEG